ncbi:hypothetical protein [Clostridium sp. UBA1056]|uniref:hypothetical protein n=1 Tax=unclassified Clostridium TaxID=2614128 RepID=UPI003216250D
MYNTSTQYKTEIKKPSRSFECRITIGDRIFKNEDIVDIIIEGNIQPQEGFSIGNTVSTTLDLTLLNNGDTIYSTNQIKVEIGLKIGNTIEYILIGLFNIDDIEKTDYTTKFTAFDNMIKFETAYFSSLGDTSTLQQVVNELASKTGVQFTGSLPSYTVKKLEGFTCREMLSYVASVCGGNAVITRDGKFTIVYPKDINYSITADNYFDYKREEVKYKIGKVTCQIKEKETISKGSLGTDSMELLFENPWVTDSILQDIYNRLNGFEYLGYSMKWQGDLSLDVGDIITCTDKKGVVRKLPILSQKLTYTGGLTSEIAAKGESKNKNSFSSSGSTANKVNRVVTDLALVNKAFVDYAHINDADIVNLKAETAKIHILEVEAANINNLLAGNISAGSTQTIHLTSKNVVIDNAIIKDTMIENISTSKIKAGSIDTNKITLSSADGGLSIVGPTMQFKDKSNKIRLQLGQDTQGNFNFILRAADGTTTLIDGYGIKEKAIANDLIKENMVAADAIGEKQINYSSLITGLNKDTNTQLIKASKVAIDLTGQSLEVSFNSLKSNMDNMEIGGRNLLRDTAKVKGSTTGAVPCNWVFSDPQFLRGKTITISIDIDCANISKGSQDRLGCEFSISYEDGTNGYYGVWHKVSEGVTFKGRKSGTFKIADKPIKSFSGMGLYSNLCNGDRRIIEFPKIETGNKATDWTPAPEDAEQKIESNTTALNIQQGKIDTLISNTTIVKDGKTIQLKDSYNSTVATVDSINSTIGKHTSTIDALSGQITGVDTRVNKVERDLDGVSSTVASHKTSITTLGTNITNANNLADSKAKVFTATPTTPYKVGDIWTSGPSGDIMKCKVARVSGAYVAADWERASKYTDDSKANAVEGKVTTVESKQASLEQNLNGFKTAVSSTYSTKSQLNTVDGKVTNLTTRIANAEQKITDSAIISTVSKTFISKADAEVTYSTKANMALTENQLRLDFSSSGGVNKFYNSKINETSNAYGFGIRSVDKDGFIAGKKFTFTINGRVVNGAGGKYLMGFIYNTNWTFSQGIAIKETTDTTRSITFTVPNGIDINGLAFAAYHYPQSGDRTGASKINWISLTEGSIAVPWSPHPNEIYEGNTSIDSGGVTIYNGAINIKNRAGASVLKADASGNLIMEGSLSCSDGVLRLNPSIGSSRIDNRNGILRLQYDNNNYASVAPWGMDFYNNENKTSFVYTPEKHFKLLGNRDTGILKLLNGGGGDIQARNSFDNAYSRLQASAFVVSSKAEFKTNITEPNDINFLDILMNSEIKKYNLKTEVEFVDKIPTVIDANGHGIEADTKIGLVLDELTEDAQSILNPYNTDGIDQYSMCSVLWKVCQDQQKRIEKLEALIN